MQNICMVLIGLVVSLIVWLLVFFGLNSEAVVIGNCVGLCLRIIFVWVCLYPWINAISKNVNNLFKSVIPNYKVLIMFLTSWIVCKLSNVYAMNKIGFLGSIGGFDELFIHFVHVCIGSMMVLLISISM